MHVAETLMNETGGTHRWPRLQFGPGITSGYLNVITALSGPVPGVSRYRW